MNNACSIVMFLQMANFTYTSKFVNVVSSSALALETTTYRVTPRFHNTDESAVMHDLLQMLNDLMEEFKEGLHPEHDRIGLSIEHPDFITKALYVSLRRPKNLTGQIVFTRLAKIFQSEASLLLDGAMTFRVVIKKGPIGRGLLKLKDAQNFFEYIKRKRGIVVIENNDNLCLPRAIVVARAYISHFVEKTITEHEYRKLKGTLNRQNVYECTHYKICYRYIKIVGGLPGLQCA